MKHTLITVTWILTILGFFVFVMWYTAYRLHACFKFTHFWVLQILVVFFVMSSFVSSLIAARFSGSFISALNVIGGYVFLFLIYLFVMLIALSFVQSIFNTSPILSGAAAIVIAFVITFVSAVMGSSFIVKETEIKIAALKKELTIMQISDVHIGRHRGRDYLAAIVEETNARNPDLILITGDLIDAEPALLPGVLDSLSNFKAPVYYVEGNHEKYIGVERVLKLIRERNIRVMHNEVIEICGIQLIGLDYMKADEDTFDVHPSDHADTVKSVLAKISLKSELPSILMSHSPAGAQYADTAGIDLMLSGHTHGGQIFPFSLLSKLTFPFNSGLYQQGNTKIFVSNGAGTFFIRARLGTFNEINLLKLMPAN